MPGGPKRPYERMVAVLATMHGKERVMAPILEEGLGLVVGLALGVDTDRFGTFSGDVERSGSPLEAARAKITAGFEYAPLAQIGLASEGSFGSHPRLPFLALGQELVLLADRRTGLELTGHDISPRTNFAHRLVFDLDQASEFASQVGFPEHGVIVIAGRDEGPAPDIFLDKESVDPPALASAVAAAIDLCGAAFLQTDMRAHRNPTRMAAIGLATRDLVRRFNSRCPRCDHPGFDVIERVPGLPCADCGEPTLAIQAEVLACPACGHRRSRPATHATVADPGRCESCNP